MRKRSIKRVEGSAESIAELRKRGWRNLRAAVPAAIKVLTEHKAKLEAQMAAGKELTPRARRELEEIRASLNRHHNQQILIRALVNQYRDPSGRIRALLRSVLVDEAASKVNGK